jgi:glutathione S-transferase
MQPIVFYADASWESPYVCSVYVALKEKNLPFEARTLDLHRGDQFQERFRRLSLTARVPCIEHGDFVLSESLAIVEYLDEIAPGQALFPRQPRARARARQVMGWLRSDLLALRELRPTSTFFGRRASAALTPAAQRDAEKLIAAAEQLVPKGEGALFGEWCLADLDLTLMLNRLVANADAVPERLVRYTTAQLERPSLRAYLQQPRPARP